MMRRKFKPYVPTPEQVARVEATAQAILDARAAHPGASLAELYDPDTMPADLRAAHEANDRAVMALYGFPPDMPEDEIVAALFELYAHHVRELERAERRRAKRKRA